MRMLLIGSGQNKGLAHNLQSPMVVERYEIGVELAIEACDAHLMPMMRLIEMTCWS